ncbi:hypothetical protein ACWDWU_12200 [Streptomyces sp. NPDC003442]
MAFEGVGDHALVPRAARHVVRALENEPAQAHFPWPTATLIRTLRTLPTPVSSWVLRKLAAD